jgi:hypothetical protein
MLDYKVWERHTETSTMPKWAYSVLVAACLVLSMTVCAVCAQISNSWDMSAWSVVATALYFVLGIAAAVAGTLFIREFKSPATILVGFLLIAPPIGLMYGVLVDDPMRIFIPGMIFAIVMSIVGLFLPKNTTAVEIFFSIGVVVMVGTGLWTGSLTWVDWICYCVLGVCIILALIFGMEEHHTFDRAVATGVGVFFGMVHVIITALSVVWARLRRVYGNRK